MFGTEVQVELSSLFESALVLKSLDGGGFVAVVGNGSFGALLESTEIELLKLDGELVDVEFILGSLGEADLELNWDDISERVSAWSSDRKVDVPDLRFVSNLVLKDGDRYGDFDRRLSFNIFGDWYADRFNREP